MTSLMQQTTVQFTITIDDNKEEAIIKLAGLLLLPFVMAWRMWQVSGYLFYRTVFVADSVLDSLDFIGKVLLIHLKAYAFGLGVTT